MKSSIVWFRDDLRIADNPALLAAAAEGAAVALYVLDEQSHGIRPLGGAAKWWLHHALADLQAELEGLGIPLLLRRGSATEIVPAICKALEAGSLYWNRRYGGPERNVDAAVKEWAGEQGIHAESFQGSLLHEPWTLRTGAGNPYQVFTPFWRALSEWDFRSPLGMPDAGRGHAGNLPEGDRLESWSLLPQNPDWAGGLRASWQPTAAAGHDALKHFLQDAVGNYGEGRDRPDQSGTSRISPYLRWGQLSPFQVWDALADRRSEGSADAGIFASELGWREFCWHQLYHHPDLATTNLRRKFDAYPWRSPEQQDPAGNRPWRAWCTGTTGIPLVDAGQRELWHTGFMHNRVRMVAASFLIKNLGIDWRAGEQWFWDTLVDADSAANPANWQWVAGSGADASPFFRIFNPVTQARKFDPTGSYVGRWVTEILEPGYPEPIVDLQETRREALDAYASIK
ncbi:deoxyribodipyrimidine photo-lyase [Arthrobacter sp. H35-D1]|uniref:cryptochrome/photolyase family protein n=1 Tax=Arthrobacter sp. H35-D1 TaxID=3046202 RepID=UPI0024BA0D37|nr:deoxyribodipyrimidine photo-lyase [Arthrobacter sp. H35-D1]MDJ0314968.1 deoxyribodipyrimidine photo-lyase [Arthrobacter sp. H35-D1]